MGKNIVVLCDGIWASPNARTNVYVLYKELLEKKYKQYVKYINGIGVGKVPLIFLIDIEIAKMLGERIKEGYKHIVNHYNPGDDIWLFGFSNGAYIARCIVGMIRNCGILKLDRNITSDQIDKRIDLAYEIYRSRDMTYHPDGSGSCEFKMSFSYPDSEKPIIKFLGLWDTVGIHGLPAYVIGELKYLEFYDMTVSRIVNFAFHALAIHETTSYFEPYRLLPNSSGTVTIKETWFPGVHNEIGGIGGNKRISKATILWMMENIVQVGGLLMCNDIEIYRIRYSPDSGSSWNIRNLLPNRKIAPTPKFMIMDRVIPLELDPSQKCLRKDLLYRDGDWVTPFDTRSHLITQYTSNTYEELRKIMEAKDIGLYNNVKYDKDEEELERTRLARL